MPLRDSGGDSRDIGNNKGPDVSLCTDVAADTLLSRRLTMEKDERRGVCCHGSSGGDMLHTLFWQPELVLFWVTSAQALPIPPTTEQLKVQKFLIIDS